MAILQIIGLVLNGFFQFMHFRSPPNARVVAFGGLCVMAVWSQ